MRRLKIIKSTFLYSKGIKEESDLKVIIALKGHKIFYNYFFFKKGKHWTKISLSKFNTLAKERAYVHLIKAEEIEDEQTEYSDKGII